MRAPFSRQYRTKCPSLVIAVHRTTRVPFDLRLPERKAKGDIFYFAQFFFSSRFVAPSGMATTVTAKFAAGRSVMSQYRAPPSAADGFQEHHDAAAAAQPSLSHGTTPATTAFLASHAAPAQETATAGHRHQGCDADRAVALLYGGEIASPTVDPALPPPSPIVPPPVRVLGSMTTQRDEQSSSSSDDDEDSDDDDDAGAAGRGKPPPSKPSVETVSAIDVAPATAVREQQGGGRGAQPPHAIIASAPHAAATEVSHVVTTRVATSSSTPAATGRNDGGGGTAANDAGDDGIVLDFDDAAFGAASPPAATPSSRIAATDSNSQSDAPPRPQQAHRPSAAGPSNATTVDAPFTVKNAAVVNDGGCPAARHGATTVSDNSSSGHVSSAVTSHSAAAPPPSIVPPTAAAMNPSVVAATTASVVPSAGAAAPPPSHDTALKAEGGHQGTAMKLRPLPPPPPVSQPQATNSTRSTAASGIPPPSAAPVSSATVITPAAAPADDEWGAANATAAREREAALASTSGMSTLRNITWTEAYASLRANTTSWRRHLSPELKRVSDKVTEANAFVKALWACWHQDIKEGTPLYEERDFILCLRHVELDHGDETHRRMLLTIYRQLVHTSDASGRSAAAAVSRAAAFSPVTTSPVAGDGFATAPRAATSASATAAANRPLDPPATTGPEWEVLGFQGLNPATDLRSTGMFGLLQLLYVVDATPTFARQLYRVATSRMQEFPFALVSLNMSGVAMDALLQRHLHDLAVSRKKKEDKLAASDESSSVLKAHRERLGCTTLARIMHEFVVGALDQFFVEWTSQPQRRITDFNSIRKSLQEACLSDAAATVQRFEELQALPESSRGPGATKAEKQQSAAASIRGSHHGSANRSGASQRNPTHFSDF